MNEKSDELLKITDNTIGCCLVLDNEGSTKITRDIILGRNKSENVQMTRTLVVCQIYKFGYTVSTLSKFFDRTPQAIRSMIRKGYDLSKSSRAYRIAEEQANLLNKQSFTKLPTSTPPK